MRAVLGIHAPDVLGRLCKAPVLYSAQGMLRRNQAGAAAHYFVHTLHKCKRVVALPQIILTEALRPLAPLCAKQLANINQNQRYAAPACRSKFMR